MPIGKDDVLAALSDPVLGSFKFSIGQTTVGPDGFRAVYDQGVVDTYAPGVVARATHSIYFEILGEHGFILFGVWLAMIGLGVLHTRRIIAASRGRPFDTICRTAFRKSSGDFSPAVARP